MSPSEIVLLASLVPAVWFLARRVLALDDDSAAVRLLHTRSAEVVGDLVFLVYAVFLAASGATGAAGKFLALVGLALFVVQRTRAVRLRRVVTATS